MTGHPGNGEVSFHTTSDASFFVGTVALLNSLRLTGNEGPLVVLDIGLAPRQRAVLAEHCRIIPGPPGAASNPWFLKPLAADEAAEIVVFLDSDVIVTRSLDPVISLAREGRLCAAADPDYLRWFAEWQHLLGLPRPPRRSAYVNAGFVAFSQRRRPELLPAWRDACRRALDLRADSALELSGLSPGHRAGFGHPAPLADGDQDVLNAILMSEPAPARTAVLAASEVAYRSDLGRVHVLDPASLACTNRRRPLSLVHCNGTPKAWESSAWSIVRDDAYLQLLRRVLLPQDVALRVEPRDLPVWLRSDAAGHAVRRALEGLHVGLGGLLERLPAGLSSQLRSVLHDAIAALPARRGDVAGAP